MLRLPVLLVVASAVVVPALGEDAPLASPTFHIPAEGSGWIEFIPVESGHIVIPVTVDGEPVRALIDTGFDYMVVSKAFAETHHMSTARWGKPAISFGGPTQVYVTPSVTLDVGIIRTTKAGAVGVTDLGQRSRLIEGGPIDLVLGLNFLSAVEWQVDQDHDRVRFLPSGAKPIGNGIDIRTGPGRSRLLTTVRVNGKAIDPVMIDTGSDHDVSLSSSTAERIGFKPATDMASVGAGGIEIESLGRLNDVRLGQQAVPNAYANTGGEDWLGPSVKALVGMRSLRHFNLTVDVARGKMELELRSTPTPDTPKSTSGIQGNYTAGKLTIAHVMKNSPAAAIGLRNGDAICTVNGKPMTQELEDQHWRRAAPGTRYVLQLCNGSSKTLTLGSFY